MYKGAAATCSLSLVGKILVGTNPTQHSTAQRSTHPAHASLGSRYTSIHPAIHPTRRRLADRLGDDNDNDDDDARDTVGKEKGQKAHW